MGIITSVNQRQNGIRGDSLSRQIEYVVQGRTLTQDEADDFGFVSQGLLALGAYSIGQLTDANVLSFITNTNAAPFTHGTLIRDSPFLNIELIKDLEPEVYIVTANYRAGTITDPPPPVEDGVVRQFEFEIATTTERVLRSRREYIEDPPLNEQQTAFKVNPFEELVPMHRAINKTPDSDDIGGIEVEIPTIAFTFSEIREQGWFVTSALSQITALVGKVNADSWSGYDRGEVLFMGVQGRVNDEGHTELLFRFKARKNRTDVVVDPNVTIPLIRGWQYLWGYPMKQETPDAPDLGIQFASFYIADLYEEANFTGLVPSISFNLVSVEGESFVTADGSDTMVIAG